jgi:hypothetical protein
LCRATPNISQEKRQVTEELQRNSLGGGKHLIHDFQCKTPASVLLSITRRQTFTCIFALMQSLRQQACFATTARRSCIFTSDSASHSKKLAMYDRNAAALVNQAESHLLQAQLNKYLFAEMIDDIKDDDNTRLSSEKVDKLLKEMWQERSKIKTRRVCKYKGGSIVQRRLQQTGCDALCCANILLHIRWAMNSLPIPANLGILQSLSCPPLATKMQLHPSNVGSPEPSVWRSSHPRMELCTALCKDIEHVASRDWCMQ